jgi:hypothetical protein
VFDGKLTRADEIGDVQEPVALLARVCEPESFGCIGFRLGEHNDVVAIGDRREVAVHRATPSTMRVPPQNGPVGTST